MEELRGYVHEVFGSFQGEGPYVGERHVFVRLSGCALGCEYCDTPASRQVAEAAIVETGAGRGAVKTPNPLTVDAVVKAVLAQELWPGFNSALCITGGEPLEQAGFVKALLVSLSGEMKVMLETNGTLPEALAGLRGLVDLVSMDVKLPSVYGKGPLWSEHSLFLDECRESGAEVVVKAVVSGRTPVEEVAKAAMLVTERAKDALLILQPVTGAGPAITAEQLLMFYREARGITGRVRVIPQVHKIMGVK
jgi:7-carboxy-7-deazaguanine synthase